MFAAVRPLCCCGGECWSVAIRELVALDFSLSLRGGTLAVGSPKSLVGEIGAERVVAVAVVRPKATCKQDRWSRATEESAYSLALSAHSPYE